MSNPTPDDLFQPDAPWGDDSQFYVRAGHMDIQATFEIFGDVFRDFTGDELEDHGLIAADVHHGYATPALYPPSGWDEWMIFHLDRYDETSIEITCMNCEGTGFSKLPDMSSPEPFGPEQPWTPPAEPDPTIGGRLVKEMLR